MPVKYGAAVLSSAIRAVEGCTVLELAGDFDVESAPRVRRTLAELVDVTAGLIVVVDLGGVTSVDAAAFGVLVAADHRLQDRGDRLQIARPSPEVLDAMHTTGIERVLRVYATVEEACVGGS